MLILQIASGDFFSTYGGGQVYVKSIVDEMIRQGYSVQVISFVNKDCAVETRDYKGTMLYEVGSNGIDRLESLIVQIRPDVIHAHSHKHRSWRSARNCIFRLLLLPIMVASFVRLERCSIAKTRYAILPFRMSIV